jgi:hypothetical protein
MRAPGRLTPGLIPALVAAACAALLWFGLMEHAGAYQHGQITDTGVYQDYAGRVADGQVPYRDFQVEYPPLAFAAWLPPRLVASGGSGYADAFTDLMGLCAVALAAVAALAAARVGSGERALAAGLLAAFAPAIAGSVALTRFDLWPTLLAALALWAAAARRDGLAAAFTGLGVAAKLWPGLLLPALLVLAFRRRGRRGALRSVAWFVLAGGVPVLLALIVSPSGLWHALSVQAGRPLQVESLGASILVGLAHLGGHPGYGIETSSGSQNLQGGSVALATTLTSLAAAAGVLIAVVGAARSVPAARDDRAAFSEAARFAFAAVVASMAFGRVLSPQYVLWLAPFPLLVRGRRGVLAAVFTLASLTLTQAEFPSRYWRYADGRFDGTVSALILGRIVALVALFLTLVVPAMRSRRLPGLH